MVPWDESARSIVNGSKCKVILTDQDRPLFTWLVRGSLNKFGLLCARVFTSMQMTIGLVMMIFYTNRTALEYGAYLIAMSSIGNLLTNITIQVIFRNSDSQVKVNVQIWESGRSSGNKTVVC